VVNPLFIPRVPYFMPNAFPPDHPKSVLYSVHTLYTIDLYELLWEGDRRYLILLRVRITMD
jgi:hypothetical protein